MSAPKERRPRIPRELAERIDVARGDVPFERWVRKVLEEALGAGLGGASGSSPPNSSASRPAPPRASLPDDGQITEMKAAIDSANRETSDFLQSRGAAPRRVSAHVRPAIPKKEK